MEREIAKKFKQVKNLIGRTPLALITYTFCGEKRVCYAKLEWYNLTGSIKDRVAYQMLYDAYQVGAISPSTTVHEITSGNMGISLAGMCNLLGNKCKIIMPKTMSQERQKLITQYGAELVLVDDFTQGFKLCEELEKQGKFFAHQFDNKSNFKAHFLTTGKEIFAQLKSKPLNNFVAGVGTSGTLMGAGQFLKQKTNCNVVGIEPETARILSGIKPYNHHKIQGLSDQTLPSLYNGKIVDKVIPISDTDAICMSQKLCKKLSLGVGISSGANFLGCVLAGDNSATVFADDNKKYLSTDLCKQATSPLVDSIDLISVEVL